MWLLLVKAATRGPFCPRVCRSLAWLSGYGSCNWTNGFQWGRANWPIYRSHQPYLPEVAIEQIEIEDLISLK
ncbi:hypothetical protein V6Z12_A01G105000 [Gossypium hirsutum]